MNGIRQVLRPPVRKSKAEEGGKNQIVIGVGLRKRGAQLKL